jgi:hypothetical protein
VRALLALIVALIAATPAAAGTWEPARRVSPLSSYAVSPTGTALFGGTSYDYDPNYSNLEYALITPGGVIGPTQRLGRYPGIYTAGFSEAAFDRRGNATMIFASSDPGGQSARLRAARLPSGATAVVGRQVLDSNVREPPTMDLTVGALGERLLTRFVNRPSRPSGLVQVLEAKAGGRFGKATTLARERVQVDWSGYPSAMVARDRTKWVFWTTEEKQGDDVRTAIRLARREPGAKRWRVRTLVRAARVDGHGYRMTGWDLHSVSGASGEVLVTWQECDATPQCRLRWRWRRGGTWSRAQTLATDGYLAEGARTALIMDRHGRATFTFAACGRHENGVAPIDCVLQVVQGARGLFSAAEALGAGEGPAMASNARGDALLLYTHPAEDEHGHAYYTNYYARIGSTTGGFGPAEILRSPDSSPDRSLYQPTLAGFGVDDAGNASFAYQSYDSIGGLLFRYQR